MAKVAIAGFGNFSVSERAAPEGYGQHKPKRCNGGLEMIAANCGLPLPRRRQLKVASAA
jgi:hypothetical protein